jgi:hypothetical protein
MRINKWKFFTGMAWMFMVSWLMNGNPMTTNSFTKIGETEKLYMVIMNITDNQRMEFANLLWAKQQKYISKNQIKEHIKKNKIKMKNFSKKIPGLHESYENITVLSANCGYYNVDGTHLHLFFYHNDKKQSWQFVDPPLWNQQSLQESLIVFLHKKKEVLYLIIPTPKPLNVNETEYYGFQFIHEKAIMDLNSLEQGLQLYASEKYFNQYVTQDTMALKKHFLKIYEYMEYFFYKPVIKDNVVAWLLVVFQIYCMLFILGVKDLPCEN